MRKHLLSFIGVVAAILFGLTAIWRCGSGGEVPKSGAAQADTLYPEATLSEGIKNEIYTLPTPFEVARMLEQAKAGYIFDITNSPDNLGRYITEKSKALNLGVYSSDLAYSTTYNKHDQAALFLNCTRVLSDELGISGVYESNLMEKLKQIGNNKDSLVVLVNRVFLHTSAFLSNQDRHFLAVLIATGAFVEGLYLAAELNVVAKDNTLISNGIIKQKDNLSRLLVILDAFQSCEKMKEIAGIVATLRAVYSAYGLEPDRPLDHQKAIELSKLVEQVRRELCTSTTSPVK